MADMYTRTEALLGSEKTERLKNSSVLICGLGGVGGYAAEALVRAGINRIGLCDFDTVDVTNLNRQILALRSDIGAYKTDAALARYKEINPDADFEVYAFRLTPDNIVDLNIGSWDYVADAIDDTPAKLALIKACKEEGTAVISSMGTAVKLDPSRLTVTDIYKTEGDPLARKMRKELKTAGVKDLKVVYSPEPRQAEGLGSISYLPAMAGLLLASEIIREICEKC